jgi:hypothetical protein
METAIAYTEVIKHIKQHENKSRLKQLQNDIEADKTGNIYLFAKDGVKFTIKRYRTGRFVKQVWN